MWKDRVVDYAAKRYKNNELPRHLREAKERVLSTLVPQHEKVHEVHFLENFQQSTLESSLAGTPVYSGLVVGLTGDYKLSELDACWLYPLYNQSLSVYASGKFNKLAVDNADSNFSCGVYDQHIIDDVGCSTRKTYTMVNMSGGQTSRDMVKHWLDSNFTVRQAYEHSVSVPVEIKNLHTTLLKDHTEECEGSDAEKCECPVNSEHISMRHQSLKHALESLSKQAGSAFEAKTDTALHTQLSNIFCRGADDTMYFLNNAVQFTDSAMVHVSPLHGYVRMSPSSERLFFPSNLLSADTYVDVNELSKAARKNVFTRCHWQGGSPINPFAMRAPMPVWTNIASLRGSRFQMRKGHFANNVHAVDILPASAVLKMTVKEEHYYEDVGKHRADIHDFPSGNNVRLHCSDDTLSALLPLRHRGVPLLNPDYYRADTNSLILPRHIVEELL